MCLIINHTHMIRTIWIEEVDETHDTINFYKMFVVEKSRM